MSLRCFIVERGNWHHLLILWHGQFGLPSHDLFLIYASLLLSLPFLCLSSFLYLHNTNKYGRCCILRCFFHHGMDQQHKKYGSAVIYAIYFTVAWLITWTIMEILVIFPVVSAVCRWSTIQTLHEQPAVVELTQTCPQLVYLSTNEYSL